MTRNVIIDNEIYKINDVLVVKNYMRKTDTVKILDILLNILSGEFVFRVKSLEFKDIYYIDKHDVLGKLNLLKGVKTDDFK